MSYAQQSSGSGSASGPSSHEQLSSTYAATTAEPGPYTAPSSLNVASSSKAGQGHKTSSMTKRQQAAHRARILAVGCVYEERETTKLIQCSLAPAFKATRHPATVWHVQGRARMGALSVGVSASIQRLTIQLSHAVQSDAFRSRKPVLSAQAQHILGSFAGTRKEAERSWLVFNRGRPSKDPSCSQSTFLQRRWPSRGRGRKPGCCDLRGKHGEEASRASRSRRLWRSHDTASFQWHPSLFQTQRL